MALAAPTDVRQISLSWNGIGITFSYPAGGDVPDHFLIRHEPMGGQPANFATFPASWRAYVIEGTDPLVPPGPSGTSFAPVLYAVDSTGTLSPGTSIAVSTYDRPRTPLPPPAGVAAVPAPDPAYVLLTFTAPDAAQIPPGTTLTRVDVEQQIHGEWVTVCHSATGSGALFATTDPGPWRASALYSDGRRSPSDPVTRSAP